MEDIKQESWLNCLLPVPGGNAGSSWDTGRKGKTCRDKTADGQAMRKEEGVTAGYADIINTGRMLCCKDDTEFSVIRI